MKLYTIYIVKYKIITILKIIMIYSNKSNNINSFKVLENVFDIPISNNNHQLRVLRLPNHIHYQRLVYMHNEFRNLYQNNVIY